MKQGITAAVQIFRFRSAVAFWRPGGDGEKGEREQEQGGGDRPGAPGAHPRRAPSLKGPVHYRCWLLERFSYWLVCHERLSVSHILIFSWLFHPVRHLSSISGHICPQITEHRIPLNLKKFVDSGTALVGRWAGTERGHWRGWRGKGGHTDTPIQPPRLITHPLQTPGRRKGQEGDQHKDLQNWFLETAMKKSQLWDLLIIWLFAIKKPQFYLWTLMCRTWTIAKSITIFMSWGI